MLNNFLLETAEQTAEKSNTFDNIISTVVNWGMTTGVRILISIVIILVTFKIINAISRRIEKKGNTDKYDKTLTRTLAYLFKISLKIVVVVCIIGYLGIDTSGLTALVASLGVCVGLAVNGALANLAGGVIIIVTRPFKIDDFIEAQNVKGVVEDIHMVCTKVRTPDNKVVYVPNGTLANGNIINYSEKETRRVDFSFSISYSEDFEKAKKVILDICNAHELVLKDPEPFVRVSEHSASSINIATRVWVKSEDYWTVNFDILESVKAKFDEENIEIPFDQLDVHVKND